MAASQPLRDVAVIMYDSGARPSEVFNLTKDAINFDKQYLEIKFGKTKAAKRKIRMTARVAGILGKRFDAAEGDLLFPGGKKGDKDTPIIKLTNSHLATIERVNKAVKETGKGQKIEPFRLYDLRHTFATRLTSSGVDLMTASVILGHSRLEMIRRYSHPTEQHQADAIEHLEQQDSNVKAFRRTA
jgi:integrase